uniref:PNT domain-containing protein n=1 Tax=Branchiostoma floridae TaxID=7739 RepID=C3Y106_BRAFL|eukprot:XP_002610129.1 hypothetical protein BRAFLDRAFT_89823 [Branchiostoma floridae]
MGSAEGLVCRRGDHSGGRHLTVSGSAMCQHADRVASSAAGNGDMYRCLCASRSRLRGVRRQLGAFDPMMWSPEHVRQWLHWAIKEYNLQGVEPARFDMDGKELCRLQRDDFVRLTNVHNGDVLFAHLLFLRQTPLPNLTSDDVDKALAASPRFQQTGSCVFSYPPTSQAVHGTSRLQRPGRKWGGGAEPLYVLTAVSSGASVRTADGASVIYRRPLRRVLTETRAGTGDGSSRQAPRHAGSEGAGTADTTCNFQAEVSIFRTDEAFGNHISQHSKICDTASLRPSKAPAFKQSRGAT